MMARLAASGDRHQELENSLGGEEKSKAARTRQRRAAAKARARVLWADLDDACSVVKAEGDTVLDNGMEEWTEQQYEEYLLAVNSELHAESVRMRAEVEATPLRLLLCKAAEQARTDGQEEIEEEVWQLMEVMMNSEVLECACIDFC